MSAAGGAPAPFGGVIRFSGSETRPNRMKTPLLTTAGLLGTLALAAQSATGTWQTIDDKTGEARSLIEIYERDGKLYGKIAGILRDDAEERCSTCSGRRKDQPYLGMEIISGAEPDGELEWDDGKIYDPESDNTYGLVLWIEPEEPDVLYVRGKHWTGLYRTQTWQRAR